MDDITLGIAWEELRQNVGDWLGYGRGEGGGERAWNDKQAKAVRQLLKEGQADFYFCGVNWSFNRPVVVLTLAQDANTVDLPADFGGVEGQMYYTVAGGTGWYAVDFGSVGKLYQAETQLQAVTGPPRRLCIEATRGVTNARGGLMRLRAWPTADQDYDLRFQYYLNPGAMSGDRPFGYGGPQHAHTLLQACKAAAERLNGIAEGPEQAKFKERLASSVALDNRNKPQNWGYNVDRSYERDWEARRNPFRGVTVTINGVEPE